MIDGFVDKMVMTADATVLIARILSSPKTYDVAQCRADLSLYSTVLQRSADFVSDCCVGTLDYRRAMKSGANDVKVHLAEPRGCAPGSAPRSNSLINVKER